MSQWRGGGGEEPSQTFTDPGGIAEGKKRPKQKDISKKRERSIRLGRGEEKGKMRGGSPPKGGRVQQVAKAKKTNHSEGEGKPPSCNKNQGEGLRKDQIGRL